MTSVFKTPMIMVTKNSSLWVVATPARLKISGEYMMILSMPVNCCVKATPMPTIIKYLVTGSGFNSGCHPSSRMLFVSSICCLIPSTTLEIFSPAGCVLVRMLSASSVRPLATSQRGDSGITVMDKTKSVRGKIAPQATITRQSVPSGKSARHQLTTKPKTMPTLIAISDRVVNFPRCFPGAISVMYIGSMAKLRPIANPRKSLPRISRKKL
mmetsp:Transcript_32927/g.60496  ORF Transcript_32927/g.60496 Transcript_32927/m.60496 type:complete len:212 (-) Transcript_32927:310-945(-)